MKNDGRIWFIAIGGMTSILVILIRFAIIYFTANQDCLKACYPQQAQRIHSECYCAQKTGWTKHAGRKPDKVRRMVKVETRNPDDYRETE